VVLVAALVCLLIVVLLISGMVAAALRVRRQLHSERNVRQCELLVDAGASRAAHRLAAEDDYTGETWDLPAETLVNRGDGRVEIEVPSGERSEGWIVRVVAEYPTGNRLSIRRTRTFKIEPATAEIQE
jgi:hypothetical protein